MKTRSQMVVRSVFAICMFLMLSSCLMMPAFEVKPGQRVQEGKVFVVGKLNYDLQIDQAGLKRSIWDGKVELIGMNGESMKPIYAPFNDYFVLKMDREDLDLIYMNLIMEYEDGLFTSPTAKSLAFDYNLPPFDLDEEDAFVYIGDLDHTVLQRNPYGCLDSRVSVVDRYEEVKEQFTGFVVDVDGSPMVPKNISQPVSNSRLSERFDTIQNGTFKVKGRKNSDNKAFALEEGQRIEPGSTLAVLAVDNNDETLLIADEIRNYLKENSDLTIISEEEMEGALPLYPACLLDDEMEFSDSQDSLLAQIGESLGTDYVYGITRKVAVDAFQEKLIGTAHQTHLWEYGVLCESSSGMRVGFTDYYQRIRSRDVLPEMPGSDWREARTEMYREFTVELSEPIAKAIAEAVE